MTRNRLRALAKGTHGLCLGLALGLCVAAVPALAQEAGQSPALDGDGPLFDPRVLDGKEGSVAIPLGDGFGLTLGGLLEDDRRGSASEDSVLGTAGHLFWRDPAEGLLGLYGHYAQADALGGTELYIGGAEAAGYWDRFTVAGAAGIEGGAQFVGTAPLGRLDLDIGPAFFSNLTGSYYPEDDLRLSIGHHLAGGQHAGQFEAEWGLDGGGAGPLSLFASGMLTEAADAGMLAGLRIYFGQNEKPLIQRDREDDSSFVGNLGSIGAMLRFNKHK
ncbi:MAG: hypothetical protein AB7P52_15020 [Alphaproteobacteria bacterium]